ncbi:hypothetical protein OD917_16250 [Flavobacterium sp. SH_e]|nr:hypothetical protein [Flavobacterium sp. SH_e]MCV2486486.1 hypothetical protein [Flavobacterium sp. SH_e]
MRNPVKKIGNAFVYLRAKKINEALTIVYSFGLGLNDPENQMI